MYDPWLVLLSIIVAVNASFVALDLASRVVVARRGLAERLWLTGGAISLGMGIWAMHFIGMLALRLPTPMSYDLWITLQSLLLAILASGIALFVATRGALSRPRLLGAGLLMGAGIAGMHYLGMHAMRMQPPIRYDPLLVALSLAIAVGASVATIWSSFKLRLESIFTAFWKKAGSAVLMSAGICGLHYAGVAAAHFVPGSISKVPQQHIDNAVLGATVGAFTLLVLLSTLFICAYDAYLAAQLETRVVERTAALDQSSAQLRLVLAQLADAQDEERRRLAAELHDIVGQNIAALNTEITLIRDRLGSAADAGLRERLATASMLAKQCIEAVQLVMAQLRPPGLDILGLPAALRWHAEAVQARSGSRVTLQIDGSILRPSPTVENALLRIYVEALSNAAKHSCGHAIEVILEQRGEQIALHIQDDGPGFDYNQGAPQSTRSGWGLIIMKERALAVGGELRIVSTAEAGTLIEFLIPRSAWQ
jgi:NO-binding membrane sensor protein with MHYT domain/two-component sensor histidine kinase